MKLKKSITTAIATTLLGLSIIGSAQAFNSQRWTVKHAKMEMGESYSGAGIRDHDPRANASMIVIKTKSNLTLCIYLYNHTPACSEHTITLKVDNHDIIRLRAQQFDNPDSLATTSVSKKLLNQLRYGHNVKVRLNTSTDGLVTIDFRLNGSAKAIEQVIGSGK